VTGPILLDLFAGAAGAGMGYHRAGFDVHAVDIEPHPDNPFPLLVADALDVLAALNAGEPVGWPGTPRSLTAADIAVIHASPPCQAHTTMSNRWRGQGGAADTWPELIGPVRRELQQWGGPYVIENVVGARRELRNPVLLHGGMFGLRVHRPRLFECNWPVMAYKAPPPVDPVGVYGAKPDGRRLMTRADGTEQRAAASLEEAQQATGCEWMGDFRDIAEAIPPAFTEYLGGQLIDQLETAA